MLTLDRLRNTLAWVTYFIHTTLDAQIEAESQIEFTLKKTKFFDRFKDRLNERLMVIRRMLEEGPKGFEGGMNARKYIGITKTSKATAHGICSNYLKQALSNLQAKPGAGVRVIR